MSHVTHVFRLLPLHSRHHIALSPPSPFYRIFRQHYCQKWLDSYLVPNPQFHDGMDALLTSNFVGYVPSPRLVQL